MGKVQRLVRPQGGIHPSGWKQQTSHFNSVNEDIVQTI